MHYRKHGLKALGLCLVAGLALMAFMASAAQANWLVEGKAIGATRAISGHTSTKTQLLSSVGAIKVEIQCELLKGSGNLIGGTLEAHATLEFSSNCTTFLNLTANAKCKPLEPISAVAKGNLILDGTTTYILVEALTAGQPFVTLHLGEGTCAIGLNFPITGSAVVECVTTKCDAEAVSHPIRAILQPSELFPKDNLLFGTNAASFHGEGTLEVGEGKTWLGVG